MVLSALSGGPRDSYITLNGVRHPVQLDQRAAPTAVYTAPQEAFPEAISLGDPARATDHRTAAALMGNWPGGMGEYRYPAGAGGTAYTTFSASDCDTRFPQSLVCRPALTRVGANAVTPGGLPGHLEYLGYTNATLLHWAWQASVAARYDPVAGTWTTTAMPATPNAFLTGVGFVFLNDGAAVQRSSDGATWAPLNLTVTAGSPAVAATITGLGRHDNKLYFVSYTAGAATLYYSTNFAGLPASVTWTAGGVFYYEDGVERIVQLIEWRDRYGRRALYCLTSRTLLGYDDDSNTWQEFATSPLRPLPGIGNTWKNAVAVWAYVWPRDDNLYVAHGQDGLLQYTGSTIDYLSPNKPGGLPLGRRMTLTGIVGNNRFIFVNGYPAGSALDSTSEGATIALSAAQGWHTLWRDTALLRWPLAVGYGNGTLYTLRDDGTVWSQSVPEVPDLPTNAVGRAYDTTQTQGHYTAIIDSGHPNIPMQPLAVEVWCRNGRALGLAAGTSVEVFYRTNVTNTWTSLGTLTSASSFPARLPINAGVGALCNDIDLRLDLSTSSSTATPDVTDLILHFIQQPMVRAQYTVTLDLRDTNPVFKNDAEELPGRYYQYTAAQLRASLYALAGLSSTNNFRAQVVPFAYAGDVLGNGPNGVSIAAAQVRVSSVEDPIQGFGVFRLAIEDLSTAASG